MTGRRRFEEIVALFAGRLLDEPDLELAGVRPEARWPELAPVRALGGPPVGRQDRESLRPGGRGARGARWVC